MLAEMNIPEVVDVAGGIQQTLAHIGLVAGLAVAGALAFVVIRKLLARMSEYTDCDYAYDRWRHADRQKSLSHGDAEAHDYWKGEEAYWSNRHDELSR